MKNYLSILFFCFLFIQTNWGQADHRPDDLEEPSRSSSTLSCSPCTNPWTTETRTLDLPQYNYYYTPGCRVIVKFKFRMCNGIPEFEIISITPATLCNCITYGDLARINDKLQEFIIGDFYTANYYGLAPDCYDYLTVDHFFESSCYYPEEVPLDPEILDWLEEHAQGETWSGTVTEWKPCDATSCCHKQTNMCLKTNPNTGRKYLFIYEEMMSPVECDVPAPDGSECWPTCGYPQPIPLTQQPEENTPKETIKLSPNPAMEYNQVTMEFEAETAGTVTIRVFNLQGQEIQQEVMTAVKGFNNYQLVTDQLKTGTYFIHLENGITTTTVKFMIFK